MILPIMGAKFLKYLVLTKKYQILWILLEGASEGARKPVYTDMSGFLNNKKIRLLGTKPFSCCF